MTSIVLYSVAFLLLGVSFFKDRAKTKKAILLGLKSFENIMPQFLSIIIIVGITLAILNPSTICKILGTQSGILGITLANIIGTITTMPTFVAFSVGNTLLKNGAGYCQVAALISSLTLIGILTFPLESKYIGKKAAFLRNFFDFLFTFLVAIFVGWVINL